jgi:hypothetical protein
VSVDIRCIYADDGRSKKGTVKKVMIELKEGLTVE